MMKLNNPQLLKTGHYINGAWLQNDATYAVIAPATGDAVGSVSRGGASEAREAIEAAQSAFKSWRQQTATARGQIIRRWADLMMSNQRDLAIIMTCEQGKPLPEAMGEIAYAASFLEWFAEEGRRTYGDIIPTHKPGTRLVVTKEPVGVVAAITPWNFPSAMITRKAGAALAAGGTMVVKPSEETPLSALALAVLSKKRVSHPACSTSSPVT